MSHRYPAMSRFVFLSVSNFLRQWCVTAVTRTRRVRHCPGIHSALLTRLPDSAFVPPFFTFGKAIGNEIPLVGRFFFSSCFRMKRRRLGATTPSSLSICFSWETVRLIFIRALRPQAWSFSRRWRFHCCQLWQTFAHEIKRCNRWITYSFRSKLSDLWPSAVHLQGWLAFTLSSPLPLPRFSRQQVKTILLSALHLTRYYVNWDFSFFFFLPPKSALNWERLPCD